MTPRALGLTLALVSSCGARTGLRVPDASTDVAPVVDLPEPVDAIVDRPPPPDVCVPQNISLLAGRAEVMFILDRSTSMSWSLTGPSGSGPSRWSLLVDALRTALPRYDATMDMGLLLFPQGSSMPQYCMAAASPQLSPRPSNTSTILSTMAATGPGGLTPTSDALDSVRRYFAAHPDPGRVRAAVLATDGAPNCNTALDGTTCPCTNGTSVGGHDPACNTQPFLCLDDARTTSAVRALADASVPTYVIGLDGDPDPALTLVLTHLAQAGGRPNPLDMARAFYSVSRGEDITAAFDRIQRSIVLCAFSLASPVPPRAMVSVSIDGTIVSRDTMRRDGWDWHDPAQQTIVLAGNTCNRVQEGVHRLVLTVQCPP